MLIGWPFEFNVGQGISRTYPLDQCAPLFRKSKSAGKRRQGGQKILGGYVRGEVDGAVRDGHGPGPNRINARLQSGRPSEERLGLRIGEAETEHREAYCSSGSRARSAASQGGWLRDAAQDLPPAARGRRAVPLGPPQSAHLALLQTPAPDRAGAARGRTGTAVVHSAESDGPAHRASRPCFVRTLASIQIVHPGDMWETPVCRR